MPGLFGLSPDEILAQQRAATDQRAQAYGQASPVQRINEGYYKAGAGLADAGAGLFGLKNPQVEQARQLQELTSGGELTPDGLIMMAKKLNDAGFTDKALLLVQKANQLKLQEAKEAKERGLAEKAFRQEDEDLINTPLGIFSKKDRKYIEGTAKKSEAKIVPNLPGYILEDGKLIKDEAAYKDALLLRGKETKVSASGVAESKETAKEKAGKIYLANKISEVTNTMADALGVAPGSIDAAFADKKTKGKAINNLDYAAGNVDYYIGPVKGALNQNTSNVRSHLERLKNLGQTLGLVDLRNSGVAPGSITVTEWPKFAADLANIDTSLDAKSLHLQLERIYKKHKDILNDLAESESSKSSGAGEVNVQTNEDLDAAVESGAFTREEANRILRDPQFGKVIPKASSRPSLYDEYGIQKVRKGK